MDDKNGWLVLSTKCAPIIVFGAVHTTNNSMRWEHCPHFTYEETKAERGNELLPARKMASKWKGHNPKGQWWITISVRYRISLSSWLWRSPDTKVPVCKGSEKRILISKSRLCSEYGCSRYNYNSMRYVFFSLLPECDFEENHLCGFVNHWNPNVNWFVGGGTIQNSHSILPQDHTFKNEMGELGTNGWLFPG